MLSERGRLARRAGVLQMCQVGNEALPEDHTPAVRAGCCTVLARRGLKLDAAHSGEALRLLWARQAVVGLDVARRTV